MNIYFTNAPVDGIFYEWTSEKNTSRNIILIWNQPTYVSIFKQICGLETYMAIYLFYLHVSIPVLFINK